jgi:hypothetical protein
LGQNTCTHQATTHPKSITPRKTAHGLLAIDDGVIFSNLIPWLPPALRHHPVSLFTQNLQRQFFEKPELFFLPAQLRSSVA